MSLNKFTDYNKLRAKGILGINQRNSDYVLRYNPRHLFPRVDDKLLTKQLAATANIPIPELYQVIETPHQVMELHERLNHYSDFVIKPARGSAGEGIIVIKGRRKNAYEKINGELLRQDELDYHLFNILAGLYSLGGEDDKAFVEYRVKTDPIFSHIVYEGVPDIRIIVFLGYPVMAMIRLPTRESAGRANLHQGAIGVGVDIAKGKTCWGVWHHKLIDEHPDTGERIADISLSNWEQILSLAAYSYELSGLGYLGVDIVLDEIRGPLMLELNARPGLTIQIANNLGLLPRLKLIETLKEKQQSVRKRVQFAQTAFAAI